MFKVGDQVSLWFDGKDLEWKPFTITKIGRKWIETERGGVIRYFTKEGVSKSSDRFTIHKV